VLADDYTPTQIRAVLLSAIIGSTDVNQGVDYFFPSDKSGTREIEKALQQLRKEFEIHQAVKREQLDTIVKQVLECRQVQRRHKE